MDDAHVTQLKEQGVDATLSTITVLMRNNALLESLADLLIKIEAKDDEALKKELNRYFSERLKENAKLANQLLSPVKP